MAELLFVYGTLRRASAHPMAKKLAREATYMGHARWRGELHDFGEHPGAVRAGTGWVRGDLYELKKPTTLDWLDGYEELDAPPQQPWFVREQTEVEAEPGGPKTAWIYRFEGPGSPETHVLSGDYVAHRAALARKQT